MNEKEKLIVKYASEYEKELISNNYSNNEVERLLNEWIKEKLDINRNNPNLNVEEFENYLKNDVIILK